MIKCKRCGKERPLKRFHVGAVCKNCRNKSTPALQRSRKKYKTSRRLTATGKVETALQQARYRCENSKCKAYSNYGGKGIKFLLFGPARDAAKALLIPQYQKLLDEGKIPSINRINPSGHYSLDNIEAMEFEKNCGYKP